VLFDFDGTLADSYDAIAASVNHVRVMHRLPPLPEPQVRCFVGRGPEHLIKHTVPGVEVDAALAMYREHHPSVMFAMTRLLPGAREAVEALHRAKVRLGVCSNKPAFFTRRLLDALGVGEFMQVVVGPENVPLPKPAPDMLRFALAQLEVEPSAALYVGDMGVDIECARAAGLTVWVVPTGCEHRETLAKVGPDRILTSLHDLVPVLVRNDVIHEHESGAP
jgi:phosphoglycolate phosphatase